MSTLKKKGKQEKGITLVALVITILLLLILATVSINVSFNHINNIRLQTFYTKLEIAEEGIEKIQNINEKYKNQENKVVYLKKIGGIPSVEQQSLIQNLGFNPENFKYYTAQQVEEELEITGVELNLLVDFEDQIVINPEGIEIEGKHYYMLENDKNKVVQNKSKNIGNVDFTYQIEKYTSNSYKVIITPRNVGDIKKGMIRYKKEKQTYWDIANDNEFIIETLGRYIIQYTDANENTITKTIQFSFDENNNIAVGNEIEL